MKMKQIFLFVKKTFVCSFSTFIQYFLTIINCKVNNMLSRISRTVLRTIMPTKKMTPYMYCSFRVPQVKYTFTSSSDPTQAALLE